MDPTTAWVGIGSLFTISVVGWVITYVRNSKSEATKFGELAGKVDALGKTVQSQQTSIDNLTTRITTRIDDLIINLTKRE